MLPYESFKVQVRLTSVFTKYRKNVSDTVTLSSAFCIWAKGGDAMPLIWAKLSVFANSKLSSISWLLRAESENKQWFAVHIRVIKWGKANSASIQLKWKPQIQKMMFPRSKTSDTIVPKRKKATVHSCKSGSKEKVKKTFCQKTFLSFCHIFT